MTTNNVPPVVNLLPFKSSVYQLLRDPSNFLLSTSQELGEVVLFRLGPLRVYLVTRAEDVHEVLISQKNNTVKGPAFRLAKGVLGDGLLTSDGDLHLRQRRLSQPAFARDRIETYVPDMIDCAEQSMSSWQDGSTIDVFAEMSKLTLQIAARTLFGVSISGREAEIRQALTDVLKSWRWHKFPIGYAAQRWNLPLPGTRRIRHARRRLDDIIYSVIRERRERADKGNDFLGRLMTAVDEEGDSSGMTDVQLRDECVTIILAGHETIATTLMWTWYELSRNPDVAETLYWEIDEVLGDRCPTVDDLPNLKFCRNIFTETMRLYPALWVFSRKLKTDVRIGGYDIRAGSQVAVSPLLTQRRSDYFPEPERFVPGRWAADSPALKNPFCYFPFGGGIRKCIGESFAWTEGPLMIAAIAQRWRLQHLPDHPVEFERSVILRSKHGMPMRIHRRTPSSRVEKVMDAVAVNT